MAVFTPSWAAAQNPGHPRAPWSRGGHSYRYRAAATSLIVLRLEQRCIRDQTTPRSSEPLREVSAEIPRKRLCLRWPPLSSRSWSQSDQGQSRFRISLCSKIFSPSLSVASRILRNRRLGIGGLKTLLLFFSPILFKLPPPLPPP